MARTGSSSLQKMMTKEHGLDLVFEPMYDINYDLDSQINDNSIVKIILWRIPAGVVDEMKWWLELCSKFDKVILLSRKNLDDCAESIAYLRHHREINNFGGNMEYVWKPTSNYNEIRIMVEEYYNKMVELSKILNIAITYYEDIFDSNSPHRLRKSEIKKKLI